MPVHAHAHAHAHAQAVPAPLERIRLAHQPEASHGAGHAAGRDADEWAYRAPGPDASIAAGTESHTQGSVGNSAPTSDEVHPSSTSSDPTAATAVGSVHYLDAPPANILVTDMFDHT